MTRTCARLVGIVVLSLFMGFGCGAEEEAGEAEEAQAAHLQGRIPKKMREIQNEPALLAQGKALFSTCAGCHGKDGEGVIGVGPRLNSESFLAAAADEWLIHTISKGRAGTTMIPWGQQFEKEQIYGLVAYMRTFNDVKPATLDERPLTGNPANGAAVFRDVCAGCHGRSGAGYQETANGTGIGRKVFLDGVSNGFIRHIVKHGKSATKMRPFAEKSKVAVANLTDQQIEDVIVHLRTNAW